MIRIYHFIRGLMLKNISFFGYQGVVNRQISIYKQLKKENRKAFLEWSKNQYPAVSPEKIFDENGHIKKDIKAEELKGFQEKNNSFTPSYPDQDIFNFILDSRRRVSFGDIGADDYYSELISIPNKTLEQIIRSIVEWEFLSGPRAYEMRGKMNIPVEFVEAFRKEIYSYIERKVKTL